MPRPSAVIRKFGADFNIDDVTAAGADVFNALVDESIPFARAKEMTNALGKMINSAKVRLEYAAQRKEVPDIPFLNGKK